MTVEEATEYLFFSRADIHTLLAAGKPVESLPRGSNGQLDIDVVSVEAHRAEMETARRAYLDSQTEDNDPLGL